MGWRGRYYDGESAVRHEVDVAIESSRIVLSKPDGGNVVWPFDLIRWTEKPSGGVAQLCIATAPDARLVVEQDDFVVSLRQVYPGIDRAAARQLRLKRRFVTTTAATLALAAATYGAIAVLPELLAPLIPQSVAETIGDAVVRDVAKIAGAAGSEDSGRLCLGKDGQAVLNRLAARLSAEAGPKGVEPVPFQVRVVNIGMVNAQAAPGGRILIFSEMLKFAESPDQLAGVLAHEMAHEIHRHPLQAILREAGISVTLNLIAGGGWTAGAAGALLGSSYSRNAEREADDTGFTLLQKAGISTAGMVRLFERLEKELPSMPRELQIISSHPRGAERAKRLAESGEDRGGPAMPDADWQALRNICEKK